MRKPGSWTAPCGTHTPSLLHIRKTNQTMPNAKYILPSFHRSMHLPNGNNAVRFGSISEQSPKKKLRGNGVPKTQNEEVPPEGSSEQSRLTSMPNEVHIHLPQSQALSEVLDTVLTAWTILVHRYQCDTFHNFTWGVKDAGENGTQCLPTADIDLSNHNTANSLRQKLGGLRSNSIPTDSSSTIFLNDGSEAEVSISSTMQRCMLNPNSGLSKCYSASSKILCMQHPNGCPQLCQGTKRSLNFYSFLPYLIPFSASQITILQNLFLFPRTSLSSYGVGTLQCNLTGASATTR